MSKALFNLISILGISLIIVVPTGFLAYFRHVDGINYNHGEEFLKKVKMSVDYSSPGKGSTESIVTTKLRGNESLSGIWIKLKCTARPPKKLSRDTITFPSKTIEDSKFPREVSNQIDTGDIYQKFGNNARICVRSTITYKRKLSWLTPIWLGGYPKKSLDETCTAIKLNVK